jgi:hypothetical protein
MQPTKLNWIESNTPPSEIHPELLKKKRRRRSVSCNSQLKVKEWVHRKAYPTSVNIVKPGEEIISKHILQLRRDYGGVQNLCTLPTEQKEEEPVITINRPCWGSFFLLYMQLSDLRIWNIIIYQDELVSQHTLAVKYEIIAELFLLRSLKFHWLGRQNHHTGPCLQWQGRAQTTPGGHFAAQTYPLQQMYGPAYYTHAGTYTTLYSWTKHTTERGKICVHTLWVVVL